MATSSDLFSDVRIFPVQGTGNLKANGKVVIAKTVEVSFRIMNGKNGMFVSLPAQKVEKDGETKYFPEVRILDKDTKEQMDKFILDSFNGGTVTAPKSSAAVGKKTLPF